MSTTDFRRAVLGIPSNPSKKPERELAVQAFEEMQGLALTALSGGLVYTTKSALAANLVPAANTGAIVIGDPTAGNDGLYRKIGGTGTGSWSQLTQAVPGFQYVFANDTGAGSANAIQATTTTAVQSLTGLTFIAFIPYRTNTSQTVTIRFNGAGANYPIKTPDGNNPSIGGLRAGRIYFGTIISGTLRLFSDEDASAVASQVAADRAAVAADRTQVGIDRNAVSDALASVGNPRQRITEDKTFYINQSSGDDAVGTGSSGSPWATLAKAQAWLASVDLGGYSVTFLCTGTFVERISINGRIVGAKNHTSVKFQSASGTPGDFVIAPDTILAALPAVLADGGAQFSLIGFRAQDAYHGIMSNGQGSYVYAQSYEFGELFNGSGSSYESACFIPFNGGVIEVYGGGLIDGNVDTIFNAQHASFLYVNGPSSGTQTLTISNNLTINTVHYGRSNSLIRYSSVVTWAYSIGAATEATLRPYILISNGILAHSGISEPAYGCTTQLGLEQAGGHFWKGQTERCITGTFTMDLSSTADTAVTVGYKPSIVIFFASVNATATRASWGMMGDSTAYGANISDIHGLTANAFFTSDLSTSQVMRFGDGTDFMLVTLKSRDNAGFTLAKARTGSITGTARVVYQAFPAL